jgi:hypothetical protein
MDAGASTLGVDLAPYVAADHHPAQALLVLIGLLAAATGQWPPPVVAPATALLDRCRPETLSAENPAKQLALKLHDRIPCFWGAGLATAVAADWAMRYLWYAEALAWSAGEAELSRLLVMARLPRYWPNAAAFVRLAPASTGGSADLAEQVETILARRRFVTLAAPPAALPASSGLDHVLAWLELGEWLALYAAALYNVTAAARVPLELLFGRP